MARKMKKMAVICLTIWLIGIFLNQWIFKKWLISFVITFGTISYHLWMRLTVGFIVDRIMKNKADYRKKWYQLRPFEKKIYDFLKMKKWKQKMPTYDPQLFSPKEHTWEEIVQAMCQAEIVHELIAVLSLVPIAAIPIYGSGPVFWLTSILSALFDLSFVTMQRYNRARVIKLLKS